MQIGIFTEMPWQDPARDWTRGRDASNREYDPARGYMLYNRYLDEHLYADEVGFDLIMLNEHHSALFCMQGVTNVCTSILARQTKRAKLVPLGNILPLWEDPLWLAEQLAMIDMISHGRLVSGIVRGGGRESMSHNAPPTFNRERFQEAHDFILKTWTTPGPFRWEGKHFQYRYVNPWALPLQKPHPPIWIPGTGSYETIAWAARHRYPYVMLSGEMNAVRDVFQYYHDRATDSGYQSGPQNVGYLFWLHIDETAERAIEAGRKNTMGARLRGEGATVAEGMQSVPGFRNPGGYGRRHLMVDERGRTHAGTMASFDEQVATLGFVAGSPKSALPRIRTIMETIRAGTLIFRHGDGSVEHDEAVRSIRLIGEEVLPAMKEMARELGLPGPFDKSPDPDVRFTLAG